MLEPLVESASVDGGGCKYSVEGTARNTVAASAVGGDNAKRLPRSGAQGGSFIDRPEGRVFQEAADRFEVESGMPQRPEHEVVAGDSMPGGAAYAGAVTGEAEQRQGHRRQPGGSRDAGFLAGAASGVIGCAAQDMMVEVFAGEAVHPSPSDECVV